MKRDASPLLKEIKKNATAHIITNLPDFKDILKDCKALDIDIKATDIYNACAGFDKYNVGADYTQKPQII